MKSPSPRPSPRGERVNECEPFPLKRRGRINEDLFYLRREGEAEAQLNLSELGTNS